MSCASFAPQRCATASTSVIHRMRLALRNGMRRRSSHVSFAATGSLIMRRFSCASSSDVSQEPSAQLLVERRRRSSSAERLKEARLLLAFARLLAARSWPGPFARFSMPPSASPASSSSAARAPRWRSPTLPAPSCTGLDAPSPRSRPARASVAAALRGAWAAGTPASASGVAASSFPAWKAFPLRGGSRTESVFGVGRLPHYV